MATRKCTLIRRLALAAILIFGCTGLPTLQRPALAQDTATAVGATPSFALLASVRMSRGYISQAAWLDDTSLLSLVISPSAVEVWRTDIDTLTRERFISNSLITGHICPLELASRLSWTLSPRRNYIFFKWFTADANRQWALLDISGAPKFRLKTFSAPPGMQIARVLFSSDDRYAVFVDDSFIEGSSVSVLVMDLQAGTEIWRVSSENLSFVVSEWWREDMAPGTLQLAASLYNGEFYPAASIATASIFAGGLEFSPQPADLITGAGADWGWAACSKLDGSPDTGYFLEIHETGGNASRIELDLRPIELLALKSPGSVLLVNSADLVTSKLWLVHAESNGAPELVDADCREISVAPGGNLLVLSGGSNEIRIYQP